jgi:hypothetical protein
MTTVSDSSGIGDKKFAYERQRLLHESHQELKERHDQLVWRHKFYACVSEMVKSKRKVEEKERDPTFFKTVYARRDTPLNELKSDPLPIWPTRDFNPDDHQPDPTGQCNVPHPLLFSFARRPEEHQPSGHINF